MQVFDAPVPQPVEPPEFESAAAVRLWLSERFAQQRDPQAILRLVAGTLGRFLHVSRVAYGEVEPGADTITVSLDWTDGVGTMVGRHQLFRDSAIVREYLRGRTLAVSDVATLDLDAAERRLLDDTQCRAFVSVPLIHDGDFVALFSVTHREERPWSHEEVALIVQAGARTWSTLQHARTLARLEASEEQFRTLAETVPGICWIASPDGTATWMNRNGRDYLGGFRRRPESATELIHPDDADEAVLAWKQALTEGRPMERTVRLRGTDGQFRPFLSRAVPVRGADGQVIRWCVVQVDLSERHAQEHRQTLLRGFSDRVRDMTDADAILAEMAALIGEELRVARVSYVEVAGDDGDRFRRYAWRHGELHGWVDRAFSFDPHLREVLAMHRQGETFVSDDLLRRAARMAPLEDFARLYGVRAAIAAPIVKGGRLLASLSVFEDLPRRWTRDEIDLIEEFADRACVAITRARAQAELHVRERNQAFLIEWSDALRGETSPDRVVATTLEGLTRHLNVSRANFAESTPDRRGFAITQEWRLGDHGDAVPVLARAGVSDGLHRAYLTGETVEVSDIHEDPRIAPEMRERYAAVEAAAFVGIPLVRSGHVRAVLSVQSALPRDWQAAEIQLLADVADRAWVALERARAEAQLQERERNQAFLIDWSDRVRRETGPRVILALTLERLGRHLGASRINYGETDRDDHGFDVLHEWRADGTDSVMGHHFAFAALGEPMYAAHMSGQPVVADDVAESPLFDTDSRPLYASIGLRALLNMPLVRDGRLEAALSIQQTSPRAWTPGEIELAREVADRTWAILERARSEERLAESEALLAAFMENAPFGMHLKDANGRYIRVNPEMGAALDRPVEEIVGAHPNELFPPAIAEVIGEIEGKARAGELASAEFHGGTREHWRSVMSVVFPIKGRGRARTAGLTVDITERKQAEDALARSREALYQTEKLSALGSLLAGVSHELNNPLSIVVAQAVMMERQARGTEIAERAQKVRRAADRCARIVQTFLAMARQKRPEREAVDLNGVVMAALELADYGLRTEGIGLTRQLAPDLPPIPADADQLHQIVINLVINAQQAMIAAGTAGRQLTVTTAHGVEPDTVTLDVSDNGPGVPVEVRRRIFEPFYTTKPQGEGTGVGLSFSQGLAEAHGGRLVLVPSATGATFRLTLPIDPALTLPSVAPEPAPLAEPGPARRRALVVDDEQEIAESLADFLALEGYATRIAVGGRAAMARLAAGEDYDLIVSDLRMPEVDGPGLHAWIMRERPELVERLAFATGDTLGAAVARFLAEAKRPVLEKPFMPDAVQRFLKQVDDA